MLFTRCFLIAYFVTYQAAIGLPISNVEGSNSLRSSILKQESIPVHDYHLTYNQHHAIPPSDRRYVKLHRRLTPGVAASMGRFAAQAGRALFGASRAGAEAGKAATVASKGAEAATVATKGVEAATVASKGSKASTTLSNVANGAMIGSLALPLLPMLKSRPKAEVPPSPPAPAVEPPTTQPTTYDPYSTVPTTNVPPAYTPASLQAQPAVNTAPIQPYPAYSASTSRPATMQPTSYYSNTPVKSTSYIPTQPTSYYSNPPLINYGQNPVVYKQPSSNYNPTSQPLQRRGEVSDKAGIAVTGLMVVGLAKQLYNAIAPKFQAHKVAPATASPIAYPSNPQLLYPSSPQYSVLHARSLGKRSAETLPFKRSIMESAGHFVTVGFAFQALKDNTGPILREMTRLEHKGIHQMKQLTNPAQRQQLQPQPLPSLQYQQQGMMYKRQVDSSAVMIGDANEEPMMKRASIMSHPAVGNGLAAAGVLVTVSMLTGMGGPYIDQGLEKIRKMMPGSQAAPTPATAYPPQYAPQYAPQYIKKRSITSREEVSPAHDDHLAIVVLDAEKSRILIKRSKFTKWFKKVWNKAYEIYNNKWVTKALAIVGVNGKMELLLKWK